MNPTGRVGVLLSGVVLLFSCALAATVVLPAIDDEALGATTDHAREFGELEQEGMRVYQSEGCWYCHTQQVRRTMTDVSLGDRLEPGDYDAQSPAMLGQERMGPDLTHIGSRIESASDLRTRIVDPRAAGRSSVHSFGYLTGSDLDALVAYLQSLR